MKIEMEVLQKQKQQQHMNDWNEGSFDTEEVEYCVNASFKKDWARKVKVDTKLDPRGFSLSLSLNIT